MTIVQETCQSTRMRGIREAARELGCTPSHLHHVLRGHRKSAKLVRKMRELGIKVIGDVIVGE